MKINSKNMITSGRLLPLLCTLLLATGTVSAQTRQVTFSDLRMTADTAMEEIKNQTGHRFVFDRSLFDASKEVEFSNNTLAFPDALQELTSGQHANYVVRGQVVAITFSTESKGASVPADQRPDMPTQDIYKKNPVGFISAATNPRPEAVKPESVSEPQPVILPEPPLPFSVYTPLDLYRGLQSATPRYRLKMNLLYGGMALAPNLAFEWATGPKQTIEISGSYNGWHRGENDTRQLVHSVFRAEYRWWTCERFNGHFFGVHAFYTRYHISNKDVPLLFKKENRYNGDGYGIGVTYGYDFNLGKRWNLELNLGIGAAYLSYDKYTCEKCDDKPVRDDQWYVGPTRLGATLSFMFK